MTKRRLARIASAAALAATGTAGADAATTTGTSTNWAGYAVTRAGGTFARVTGSWTVPSVACTPGRATYSASWIGLGGLADRSQALEQLGTESDCTRSGRAVSSAWFEVIPAAATDARMTVRPGDRMAASVTVTGRTVRLRLKDLTRGTSEQRTVKAAAVDLSSAEWIVEAPSLCSGSATPVTTASCTQTELADFGTTGFTDAKATSSGGHVGAIADPRWDRVRITLRPSSTGGEDAGAPGRFREPAATSGASAAPGALTTPSSFTLAYDAGTQATARTTTTTFGVLRRGPLGALRVPRAPWPS